MNDGRIAQAQMQPVEAAFFLLGIEPFQLARLLLGQRLVGDVAERVEELGHEPLLALDPAAVEGSLQRFESLVTVRAGLVLQLRCPAPGQHFQ